MSSKQVNHQKLLSVLKNLCYDPKTIQLLAEAVFGYTLPSEVTQRQILEIFRKIIKKNLSNPRLRLSSMGDVRYYSKEIGAQCIRYGKAALRSRSHSPERDYANLPYGEPPFEQISVGNTAELNTKDIESRVERMRAERDSFDKMYMPRQDPGIRLPGCGIETSSKATQREAPPPIETRPKASTHSHDPLDDFYGSLLGEGAPSKQDYAAFHGFDD